MTDPEFKFEYECPECKTMATFTEGPLFGALQCGNCYFTPPSRVRQKIRETAEDEEAEYP